MGVLARPVPHLPDRAGRRPPKPPEGDGAIRVLTAIGITLILATTAVAANPNPDPPTLRFQLAKSQSVIRFFDNHHWLRAPRHGSCSEVPWRRSCRIARRVYRTHHRRIPVLQRRLFRTLPTTNDWRTAVRLAQRVYPGTQDWLLYISDREGGYGPFVLNHQGSGAGGWMQFMASTFYAYMPSARADAERRGFRVPAEVWDWHRPLGQALTAGYMRYTGRDGCHWCL